MGGLIGNNKIAFAEKLMKDIRAREERENIDVIGGLLPVDLGLLNNAKVNINICKIAN
jgi:hypothetical protein